MIRTNSETKQKMKSRDGINSNGGGDEPKNDKKATTTTTPATTRNVQRKHDRIHLCAKLKQAFKTNLFQLALFGTPFILSLMLLFFSIWLVSHSSWIVSHSPANSMWYIAASWMVPGINYQLNNLAVTIYSQSTFNGINVCVRFFFCFFVCMKQRNVTYTTNDKAIYRHNNKTESTSQPHPTS